MKSRYWLVEVRGETHGVYRVEAESEDAAERRWFLHGELVEELPNQLTVEKVTRL